MKIPHSHVKQDSSQPGPGRVSRKLALAAGGSAAALTGLPTAADADVVKSMTVPLSPPAAPGIANWDVDGDGIIDFLLKNSANSAKFDDQNGGRFVVPVAGRVDGIMKLPAGSIVGSTLLPGLTFFASAQVDNTITTAGAIDTNAQNSGWSLGDTGFFGFKFTIKRQ